MRQLITLLLAVAVAGAAQDATRPPNVVLIMADDVGYECFGAYGSRQYSTPRIDRLADEGVLFTNCYSTPLCTPSRVALMTGKSNVRNYVTFGALSPDEFTVADLFRNAGYATAVGGKWQLQGGDDAAGVPAGRGFDTYCLWNTGKTGRDRYWKPSLESDGRILESGPDVYGPDVVADFLLEFVEQNRNRPFLVYYPMILGHSPFEPTPHSRDRESTDRQANFVDMVEYTDFIVGRIRDRIEELGLLRRTVFVFTSDNGNHHTLVSELQGRTIHGDKGAPTDAGTHVPLIVSAPGIVAGGRVLDDLIDFSDFLPTLADAARLELPAAGQMDGRSFWDRLQGKPGNPRLWLFTYYFPRPFATEFDSPYRHPEIRYVRDKRYKLYADGQLFDVRADPDETRPVSIDHETSGPVRARLQSALESMPVTGEKIGASRSRASKGWSRPRWRPL